MSLIVIFYVYTTKIDDFMNESNVLKIKTESDFTLCGAELCGYYKYRYVTPCARVTSRDQGSDQDNHQERPVAELPAPGSRLHSSQTFWLLTKMSWGPGAGARSPSVTRTFIFLGQIWQLVSNWTRHIYALFHSSFQMRLVNFTCIALSFFSEIFFPIFLELYRERVV